MTPQLVAGIGCRRGAPPEAILGAVALALRQAGRGAITLLATIAAKREEPGIAAAAEALAVPLRIVAEAEAAAQPVLTESAAARRATGLGSVAEAAALAAAGPGARLLAPRSALGAATCALAESPWAEPAP